MLLISPKFQNYYNITAPQTCVTQCLALNLKLFEEGGSTLLEFIVRLNLDKPELVN